MTKAERHKLIERYASGPDEVASSIEGISSEGLTAHPLPGKWSAAEIVHHLADSETIAGIRLRKLLVEDKPVIHGYDQDAYAARLRYNLRDLRPAWEAFRSTRGTTLQLLRGMSEEDWQRTGWHTDAGLYTPERWLEIYAEHAHKHAEQIRRLKAVLEDKYV
jgi:hypothetical protein